MVKIYSNASINRLFTEHTGSPENIRYGLSYRLEAEEKSNGKVKFSYPKTLMNRNKVLKKVELHSVQKELLRFHQSDYLKAISESEKDFVILNVTQLSPYISGLGEPHVTETGLTLHPTYGAPYLPGSGIKGMFQSWLLEAIKNEDNSNKEKEKIEQLFGVEDEDGKEKKKGILTFHDVIFPNVSLEPDIMTPHHSNYYNGNGLTDNEYPNPVMFLRAKFAGHAHLIISGDTSDLGGYDLEEIAQWMAIAMKEYGLGAKTAVGYGRFEAEINDDKKKDLLTEYNNRIEKEQEQMQRESMSEEDRFIFDSNKTIEMAYSDKDTFDTEVKSEEFLDSILTYHELVQAVADLFIEKDVWKKPSKKMLPKVKKLKNVLQSKSGIN